VETFLAGGGRKKSRRVHDVLRKSNGGVLIAPYSMATLYADVLGAERVKAVTATVQQEVRGGKNMYMEVRGCAGGEYK
jgi:hypothetical protein